MLDGLRGGLIVMSLSGIFLKIEHASLSGLISFFLIDLGHGGEIRGWIAGLSDLDEGFSFL